MDGPLSAEGALDKARNTLILHHGDPANRKHLLGFFEIQFGSVPLPMALVPSELFCRAEFLSRNGKPMAARS